MLMTLAFAAVLFGLTLWLRLLPMLGQPHRGTDAFVFLMYRDEIRKQKRFPVTFPPYFTLEQAEMWYPPGFAVFLALLPDAVIKRWYWIISPAMDSLINVCLLLVMRLGLGLGYEALVPCLLYAISPAAIPETIFMTSRQLGSLLLNATVFLTFLAALNPLDYQLLAIALFAVFLLLMTHKLSTQAWFLGMLTTSFVLLEPRIALIMGAGVLFTFLLSLGTYRKILIGHWSFVHFHSHNWQYVSAHMVDDSPIFSKRLNRNSPYAKGLNKGTLFTNQFLLENAYAVAALFVVWDMLDVGHFSGFIQMCAVWCLAVLAWGLAIYWAPFLRGIGFGSQYGKLAAPAGLICAGAGLTHPQGGWLYIALALIGLQHARMFYTNLENNRRSANFHKWDAAVTDPMLAFIKQLDNPLVFTIPLSYSDFIAYHAEVRVLWGGHNYPTQPLTPVYPIIREPLADICRNHGVTHILVDTRYTSLEKMKWQSEPIFKHEYIEIHLPPV